MAFISNTCACIHLYKHFNIEYNHPFIGSLFVNDDQYIKFCSNFNYYINCTPIINKPNDKSIFAIQNEGVWYKNSVISTPYVVIYLDDIEIHMVHETDEKIVLETYNRRLKRYKQSCVQPIFFILSCSELINDHSEDERIKLLKEFVAIKNSVYICKDVLDLELNDNKKNIILYKEWTNTTNERNSSHFYKFNDHGIIANIIIQYISQFI